MGTPSRKKLREIIARLENLKEKLDTGEAIILLKAVNLFYLTGKDLGTAIITQDENVLWLKDLYIEHYSDFYLDENYPFSVRNYDKEDIKRFIEKSKIRILWIENLNLTTIDNLKKMLPGNIKITQSSIVENMRIKKSKYEISILKKSCKLAKKTMNKCKELLCSRNSGLREIELAAEIEAFLRKNGSEEPPFGIGSIISANKNSADIHAKPGNRKIPKRGSILVDIGAKIQGYYSDMTRTFLLGNIKKKSLRDMIDSVKNLELEVIDMIYPGISAKEVHEFVQRGIEKISGRQFYHSTGHGVGLEIHERPNLGPDSNDILDEGMVFTVEPGVYIPRKFGIRFEDTVLLTRNKCRILTK